MRIVVCKWCGREFDADTRNFTSAGNWIACSESCRQSMATSIASGDLKAASRFTWKSYLLLGIVALFFICGMFGYFDSDSAKPSGDTPVEQTAAREEPSANTSASAQVEETPNEEVTAREEPSEEVTAREEPAVETPEQKPEEAPPSDESTPKEAESPQLTPSETGVPTE